MCHWSASKPRTRSAGRNVRESMTVRLGALVMGLGLVLACGSPPYSNEPNLDGLRSVAKGVDEVSSKDGHFSIATVGNALTGSGAAFGYDDADFGIQFPEQSIVMVVYGRGNAQETLDSLVHDRRSMLRKDGRLRFVSEERFFLSTGHYRAASLCFYERSSRSAIRFYYALVADSPHGKIEVLGWTDREDGREALRAAVLRLRLENEK